MIRGLFIITYKDRGILLSHVFSKLSGQSRIVGNESTASSASDSFVKLRSSGELAGVVDPESLHERILRTLEEILPPVWDQLGASDSLADREQIGRLEDYTVIMRRVGDVVTVFIGEREHEALLLLEFARSFEACVRRTLLMENPRELDLDADGARDTLTSGYFSPTPMATVERYTHVHQTMVERYEELCMVVDEMVTNDGIVNHLDAKTVSSLVWAHFGPGL